MISLNSCAIAGHKFLECPYFGTIAVLGQTTLSGGSRNGLRSPHPLKGYF